MKRLTLVVVLALLVFLVVLTLGNQTSQRALVACSDLAQARCSEGVLHSNVVADLLSATCEVTCQDGTSDRWERNWLELRRSE